MEPLISIQSKRDLDRFIQDFFDWFDDAFDKAVFAMLGQLEQILNEAAYNAIVEYYQTWAPKMYSRTYQLYEAYDIRVVVDEESLGYDIEGLDEIHVERMMPYHSIYGDNRELNSNEMRSVVEYIMDGSRPIPPHIHKSPYPSSYGPISITIEQFDNAVVEGNSVAEIVQKLDQLDKELNEYTKRVIVEQIQPSFNRFIRSWK